LNPRPSAFAALRRALGHMGMIVDPLAEAIAKQFADRSPH
jgi:hypothetical protein